MLTRINSFKKILSISARLRRGFTLYEMLICISIITIVAGIALYSHKQFQSDIEITNLAYKIALEARQAQVFSISVRQFSGPLGQQNYEAPYGLHFSKSVSNALILFADYDGDGRYTSGTTDDMDCIPGTSIECIEKLSIEHQNIIKGWCGLEWASGFTNCFITGDGATQFLDIMFRRPNPDAMFHLYDPNYDTRSSIGGSCENSAHVNVSCTAWAICLLSPEGREKRVMIYDTGQISVENITDGGEGTPCGLLRSEDLD